MIEENTKFYTLSASISHFNSYHWQSTILIVNDGTLVLRTCIPRIGIQFKKGCWPSIYTTFSGNGIFRECYICNDFIWNGIWLIAIYLVEIKFRKDIYQIIDSGMSQCYYHASIYVLFIHSTYTMRMLQPIWVQDTQIMWKLHACIVFAQLHSEHLTQRCH